jgi:hypothetical protein
MKIRIKSYWKMEDYLYILNDYHFSATKIDPQTREIEEGYIELNSLEDLFLLAERIHHYFKSHNLRDKDLLVIVYDETKQEFVLEIYDDYRE